MHLFMLMHQILCRSWEKPGVLGSWSLKAGPPGEGLGPSTPCGGHYSRPPNKGALYFLPPASQEFRFGTSVLSLEAHGCWSLASSHQGPTPWGFLLPNSPIKMLFSQFISVHLWLRFCVASKKEQVPSHWILSGFEPIFSFLFLRRRKRFLMAVPLRHHCCCLECCLLPLCFRSDNSLAKYWHGLFYLMLVSRPKPPSLH